MGINSMKQHYYIHIGNGKTGTTSIQSFLNANRELLKSSGVYYPEASRRDINHHFLIVGKGGGSLGLSDQKEQWKKVKSEAEASGCPKVVISSERLASLASRESVNEIKNILGNVDVSIIYYVRRHDAYMQSAYIQGLKSGDHMYTPDEMIKEHQKDYLKIADRWATVFGDENLIVYPFEKLTLTPSLIHTFFQCIGEEVSSEYRTPKVKNVSPHPDVLSAMVKVTEIAKLNFFDAEDLKYVNTSLHKAPCGIAGKKEKFDVFSFDQKKFLLDSNKEKYAEIAKRFLGRDDGCLFHDMSLKSASESEGNGELSNDSLFMMMVALQVENVRRLNRLQRKMPQYALKKVFRKIAKVFGK